jgi:TPR repeat protein
MRQTAHSSLIALSLCALSASVPTLASPAEDEAAKQCNQLAAAVDDKTKPANVSGVEFGDIDGAAAVAACEKAVAAFPNELRIIFQLGRAQQSEGSALEKAIENYSKAAAGGQAVAMNHLGFAFENGTGVEADLVKATQWYQKAAEAGAARAQRNLGLSYKDGTGVPRDAGKAMMWFMKSADQGYAPAMNYVGILHEDGWAVKQDYAEAAKWYEKAVNLGDLDGMNNLGLLFETGSGVVKDEKRAVELFEKASKEGNAGATANLGRAYENGIGGLSADNRKSLALYKQSSDAGDPDGMYLYGTSLILGSPEKWQEGIDLLTKATDAGSERAAFELGKMKANGELPDSSPAKAAELFVTALEGLSTEAKIAFIEEKGAGFKPEVLNALQDALIKRGANFEKGSGSLSPGAITYMQSILAGG